MRLHPSALYKPSTLAKLQQLLELILGADINLLDSASSSPPSTTRGHHSSSSAMDLGSELSAGDFDGAHVRSRANTFLSQVDLPTSILALRLANYVVSVFPEALHNLMTRYIALVATLPQRGMHVLFVLTIVSPAICEQDHLHSGGARAASSIAQATFSSWLGEPPGTAGATAR